jgi:large repetitive protein
MRVSVARSSVRLAIAVLLVLPLLALGPGVPSAVAAAVGPTNLSPDVTTVSGTPVFSWDPVPNATSYDVEVWDGQPGVGTKVASVSNTVNKAWVPTVQLPTGHALTWQVRALAGVDTDWSTATFTRAAVSAPGLVAPVGGVTLDQPGDPLLYRWTAVPGASSYTVEVGPDPDFVDPNLVTTYTTSATSYSPNIIPADGHYYWRVTATLGSGVKSDRSAVEDYSVTAVVRSGGSVTTPQLPQYPALNQTIKEVVLDWHPIDGASSYKLQISTDSNFLTVVHTATTKSTRYSPTTTLDNDQYWWRVAPINADGYQTPWGASTPTWNFTRRWPDQATLQYPADGALVGDPFYFQWSPVPLASRYEIEMSTSPTFTPDSTVCSTVHTTYTPSKSAGDCWPGAANTYYWRVKAYDDPEGVISEFVNGQVHSFTYDPDLVTQLAPAPGATVQIPTLSWQPFPNAAKYKVSLTPSGGSTTTKTTVTTTMTWPSKLTNGVTYKWQVQPVFEDGRTGASILLSDQRSFTAQDPPAGAAVTPEPVSSGPAAVRPPILDWTPVVGATSYSLQVRLAGTIGWHAVSGTFAYPSGNDTAGDYLDPGTYDWQVVVNGGANDGAISSSTGSYTILPFGAVGGYRAANTGNDSGSLATSCAGTLPAGCQNVRQTPLLRWDPVDGAAWYKIVISNDINLTNPVKTVIVKGTNVYMSPSALPDADAGTAYFWEVVPCGPSGVCKALAPADHQFNKQGLAVQLSSPADSATLPNDITFSWQDYLSTLQSTAGAGSSLPTAAGTEAMQYRIQVDDNADFSSPLDTAVVDQTTYTPYSLTYPEQPLYWRVQAIDGTGNALPWSTSRTVTKSSPAPVLSSGPTFNGSIALGWDPLAYAKTYTVQVFPQGVNPDLATPLLSKTALKQNAYTPAAPLPPGNYIWRVRRADADGRAGQWSDTGSFASTGSAPTLVSPADGAQVPPKYGLFSWQPASLTVPVASWRIALSRAGGSTITQTTAATAYTPTGALADGNWSWTVTALDTTGAAIGQTATRQFVVAGTLAPGPVTITGNTTVGSLLTINPLSWNVQPDSVAYQWYSGSTPVAAPAGTGPTYTIAASDAGKAIKVKVTGFKDGYNSGSGTYSNAISAPGATTGGTGTGTTTKATSQTTISLARKKIRKRRHGLVYANVIASIPPSGTIRAYDGSRLLTSVTLSTASGGKISIRLPRLKVGRHRIWVKYLGSSKVTGSTSGRVTLRVIR